MEMELIRGCLKYVDHRQARLSDEIVDPGKPSSIHAGYRMPTIRLKTLHSRNQEIDRSQVRFTPAPFIRKAQQPKDNFHFSTKQSISEEAIVENRPIELVSSLEDGPLYFSIDITLLSRSTLWPLPR